MTSRTLLIRMKRLLKLPRILELSLIFVLIIYLNYILLTALLFHPRNSQSIDTPRPLFTIPKRAKMDITEEKPKLHENEKCPVTVAIILCEDDRYLTVVKRNHNKNLNVTGEHGNGTQVPSRLRSSPHSYHPPERQRIAKDFSRQINQTLVLLKSIAILTEAEDVDETKWKRSSSPDLASNCVEALLLSDKPTHYKIIKEEMRTKWSVRFRKLIKVTNVPVRYPPGSEWLKNLFRPCATLRLFLAELLPEKNWQKKVIYLDTDVIFFQSVQKLWSQFDRFDDDEDSKNDAGIGTGRRKHSRKVAAMAPCLVHYGTPANSIPYFGSSGLNAGIMLMNLTRMRTSQWTNKVRMVTTMFHDKIKLADQDILNIYFHFFPEELHLLTCDWNFRPFQCRAGSYCEDPEISQGISALHGNALSFTPQGPEPLFHSVFRTFHRAKLDDKFELKKFVKELESSLMRAEESAHKFSSQCKRFGGLDVLLLNRLYGLIE